MLQNISFFFNFFLFRSSFHFILLLSFRNATGLACATKKGEEEEEKSRGHVCSFERQHEVISFANFFFLSPRHACTRMSGIMNYRVWLLDTFSFPCFTLLIYTRLQWYFFESSLNFLSVSYRFSFTLFVFFRFISDIFIYSIHTISKTVSISSPI